MFIEPKVYTYGILEKVKPQVWAQIHDHQLGWVWEDKLPRWIMYIHQDSEPQTRKGDCHCVEITSQEHDIESQLMVAAGAVAQQLRTQATLPEDLGLVSNTQMV